MPRNGHTLHDLPESTTSGCTYPRSRAPRTSSSLFNSTEAGSAYPTHSGSCTTNSTCAVPAVVVTDELPLAPKHRLPAQIYTGVDVLRRLRAIALTDAGDLLDIAAELLHKVADFSRVFLIRDSSGDNLVYHVATHVGEDRADNWAPLRVAGSIPIHRGFVCSTRSKSELEGPESVFFTLEMANKLIAMALPKGATKDHPYTCPMGLQAPLLESVPLPPMLVAVAENGLIRDTNLEYCDARRAAGKKVEVLINRGMSHSFYLNKFAVEMDPTTRERIQELIDATKSFIARH